MRNEHKGNDFFFKKKEEIIYKQTKSAHVFEIRLGKVVHIYYINGEVDV